MPDDLTAPFNRVSFRDGQLLAAADLGDVTAAAARFRRLHSAYLHGGCGIALGFDVDAQAGDASVLVGKGFAIDSLGREILLAENLNLPVPQMESPVTLVLTAGYQDDTAFRQRPEVAGLCFAESVCPRSERPALEWRLPSAVRPGLDVPLAGVEVVQGTLGSPPDLDIRARVPRIAQPRLAFGLAEPSWIQHDGFWRTTVDTGEAGFTAVPAYFAALHGTSGSRFKGNSWAFLGLLAGAIEDATESQFTYALPDLGIGSIEMSPGAIVPGARICWAGIQPPVDGEPGLTYIDSFLWSGLLMAQFTATEILLGGSQ